MKRLTVQHSTTYRYRRPVAFGPHRMLLRPRDSHDLRLVSSRLLIDPEPRIRWMHDVFGNSVTLAEFQGKADTLTIESVLTIERYALDRPAFELTPEAASYPFLYSPAELSDLGRLAEPHCPDPEGRLAAWARRFVTHEGMDTRDLLAAMNGAIRGEFEYRVRDEEGTQDPLETFEKGGGTCRDYAFLMMEAARHLGFAARFVTGYLYDPALDSGAAEGMVGAGATHAWCEIYLPGAGWVEYDPTNALIAHAALIRVAVTRDPAQASTISGSFIGAPEDYAGMDVVVNVRAGGG